MKEKSNKNIINGLRRATKGYYKTFAIDKMGHKYMCDRCGKLLTDKEYEKSDRSVTSYEDFCKGCFKDWIKFRDKQEIERVKFMNKKGGKKLPKKVVRR